MARSASYAVRAAVSAALSAASPTSSASVKRLLYASKLW